MKKLFLVLALLFLSTPVYATTYWLATTGSDANSCASVSGDEDPGTYKLTITAGLSCLSAGDTLLLRGGTYAVTAQISNAIPSGISASSPTLISSAPGETATIAPSGNFSNTFLFTSALSSSRSFITFRSLIFDSINHSVPDTQEDANAIRTGNTAEINGLVIEDCTFKNHKTNTIIFGHNTHDSVIRRNIFQGLRAGTQQGAGAYIYMRGPRNIIEKNEATGGRKAIEVRTAPAVGNIVRSNYFHDQDLIAIGISSGGSGADANLIFNNIVTNSTDIGVRVFNGGSYTKVYHNTIFNVANGIEVASFAGGVPPVGVEIKNNIVLNFTGSAILDNATSPFAASDNLTTGTAADIFTDPTADDFTLKAGSVAINAAPLLSGFVCSGTGATPCDQGAFETFGFAGATINGNTMDVTLNPTSPLLAASGQTGWTVNNGRTVTSAQRLTGSDTIARLTFSGASCIDSETWTVSQSGTGNVTNSALIGNSLNQPLHAFTNQAVTNNCAEADPGPPPSTGLHVHYKLDDGTGTNANDETVNNLDGTLTGGPTWVTGKTGQAVSFAEGVADYIAVPYGNTVNPSTQPLVIIMSVLPGAGMLTDTTHIFGVNDGGARVSISAVSGTWRQGIQSSSINTGGASEFPVQASYTWVGVVLDGSTSTLWVNGVKGTSSQAVKSYTSYAIAQNFNLGRFAGQTSGDTDVIVDEFWLYQGTLTDQEMTDHYDAWNPPPPPTGGFAQVAHQFYTLRNVGGAPIKLPYSGAAVSAQVTLPKGAAFSLITQTDCTGEDCAAIGQRIAWNRNGGSFTDVGDVCDVASLICFYGNTAESDIVSGTVTCCLSGALTANNGETQKTASPVPQFDLAQDASIVQRRVLKISASATPGDVICLKEREQNGNAFTTYTPTAGACVTVTGYTSGAGF